MEDIYSIFIDLNETEYIADATKARDIDEAVKLFKLIYQIHMTNEKIKEFVKVIKEEK